MYTMDEDGLFTHSNTEYRTYIIPRYDEHPTQTPGSVTQRGTGWLLGDRGCRWVALYHRDCAKEKT